MSPSEILGDGGMEKIMRQKSVDRRVFEGLNAIIVMVW